MQQAQKQKVFENIRTITKTDYFFEEFGNVKAEGNDRWIELDGHVLRHLENFNNPVLNRAEKGDRILETTYNTDNGLNTEFSILNKEGIA